jgi:hypothetical protein
MTCYNGLWEVDGEKHVEYVQWENLMPIYKNRIVLQGLLPPVGLPIVGFGLLWVCFYDRIQIGEGMVYALGLFGIFYGLVLSLLINRYIRRFAPGYIIDSEGIVNYSIPKKTMNMKNIRHIDFHQKYNHREESEKRSIFRKSLFRISFIPKLFRRYDAGVGTGILAQTHQISNIKWKDVVRVKYSPKRRMVTIKSTVGDKVFVFCDETNYEVISQLIFKNTVRYSTKGGT